MLANPLNESSLAFPLLESLHLAGIVCGLGAATLMDLRLLGAIRQQSPAEIWAATRIPALAGLSLAIFSGLLLFSIDPEKYLTNVVFRYKLVALLLALGVHYTLVRRTALQDRQSAPIGLISLVSFSLVPLGGIFIGYQG